MPSLKAIKIEQDREESEEEEEEQGVRESQRVMWDQEETEALRKLFEGHMASFKGRKPPVDFISSVLRDKKETGGEALDKQKGTNSQKNSGQYLQIIETTLNSNMHITINTL